MDAYYSTLSKLGAGQGHVFPVGSAIGATLPGNALDLPALRLAEASEEVAELLAGHAKAAGLGSLHCRATCSGVVLALG